MGNLAAFLVLVLVGTSLLSTVVQRPPSSVDYKPRESDVVIGVGGSVVDVVVGGSVVVVVVVGGSVVVVVVVGGDVVVVVVGGAVVVVTGGFVVMGAGELVVGVGGEVVDVVAVRIGFAGVAVDVGNSAEPGNVEMLLALVAAVVVDFLAGAVVEVVVVDPAAGFAVVVVVACVVVGNLITAVLTVWPCTLTGWPSRYINTHKATTATRAAVTQLHCSSRR